MALADYNRVIDEAAGYGYLSSGARRRQPNQHPDFVEILDYTWSKGIVPNYTKTGEAEPAVRIKMLHTNIDELGLEHPQLVLALIYLTYYNSRRPYS